MALAQDTKGPQFALSTKDKCLFILVLGKSYVCIFLFTITNKKAEFMPVDVPLDKDKSCKLDIHTLLDVHYSSHNEFGSHQIIY